MEMKIKEWVWLNPCLIRLFNFNVFVFTIKLNYNCIWYDYDIIKGEIKNK